MTARTHVRIQREEVREAGAKSPLQLSFETHFVKTNVTTALPNNINVKNKKKRLVRIESFSDNFIYSHTVLL